MADQPTPCGCQQETATYSRYLLPVILITILLLATQNGVGNHNEKAPAEKSGANDSRKQRG